MKKSIYFLTLGALVAFSSCKEEPTYSIPTTYNFENVSYGGQMDRLDMMAEMSSYIKDGTSNPVDAMVLDNMFENTNNPFSTAALNSSTKQLKSKTYNVDARAYFEACFDSVAMLSTMNTQTAANGVVGSGNAFDGNTYLFAANGLEYAQLIEKGLMGACFYYQMTGVYLGDGKMNVDNETVVTGEGTAMEHHWDEAFGYFGVPKDFPANTTGVRFWGKYTNKRDAILGSNAKLMDAFLAGRAAISNKDMAKRDESIDKVREQMQLMVAGTAIAYLNDAKDLLADNKNVKALHALSEVCGFVLSLKYGTGSVVVSSTQVETILETLTGSKDPRNGNLYNVDATKIDNTINAITAIIPALEDVKTTL